MLIPQQPLPSGTLFKSKGAHPEIWPVRRRVVGHRPAFVEEKASCGHGQGQVTPCAPKHTLAVISFSELAKGEDLTTKIEQALGPHGQGALVISNVPRYSLLRKRLLPLAREFAALPDETKAKYVDPISYYSFGWSHGKESLATGVLDTLKGSFYANPLVDDQLRLTRSDAPAPWACEALRQALGASATQYAQQLVSHDTASVWARAGLGEEEMEALRQRHPAYYGRNLWPREELPELEVAFKDLGQLICAVGCLLMDHCDRYMMAKLGTPRGQLSGVLHRSLNPKARLLHYFAPQQSTGPPKQVEAEDETAWCGLHTDHGSLTGLTAAMYVDDQGGEVPCPDPQAGLYIRDRDGNFHRAAIPQDCIAFQVGEALQVHSGGLLMATPHYVRAPRNHLAQGISRNTFAVFMQPDVNEPMDCPVGVDPRQVAVGQWQPGQTFGDFAEATFEKYYMKTR